MGVTLLSITWSVAACRIDIDRASYNPLPPWVCKMLQTFTASRPSHDPTAAFYTGNKEEKKGQDDVNVSLGSDMKSLSNSPREAFQDTRSQNRIVEMEVVQSIDDWCLVTKAVDKFFFGIFLLQFIISSIYFFMVQRYLD